MLAVPPCRLLVARHVAGLRRILDSPFDTKDGKISRPISNLHHPDHEAERAARFPGRRRTRRRAAAARHLGLAQPAISAASRNWKRNWARRCSSATPRACSSRRSDRPSCAAPPPSTMRSSAPATRRANCAAPSTAASRWACPPPRTWSCSPTCCRVPRALSRHPPGNRRRRLSAGRGALLDGSMDFYVGPAPARVPGELRVEKLFDNTRVILGRKGHPLAQAKSLRELATPTGSPRPSPTRPRKNWARCSRSMACPRRSWRCGRNPR